MTRKDNRKSVPCRGGTATGRLVEVTVTLLVLLAASTGPAAGRAANCAVSTSPGARGRDSAVLECSVPEELHPVAVGNIVADYGLDRDHPPDVIKQLRFRFLIQSTPAGMYYRTSVTEWSSLKEPLFP